MLFSVDSLVADGAWVGFRVSILMPRKAWNAGPKPEVNLRVRQRFLEGSFVPHQMCLPCTTMQPVLRELLQPRCEVDSQ